MQPSHVFDAYAATTQPRARAFDHWIATRLQNVIEPAAVRLELWDGSSPYSGTHAPIGSVLVHDRGALVWLFLDPDLRFGEAYMAGRLEIRGDLGAVVEALTRVTLGPPSWRERLRGALESPNSPGSARCNVRHHYDLGNAFYQQWLDSDLVYTCAYFERADMTLEGYAWCVRKGDYLNVGIGRRTHDGFADHLREFAAFLAATGRVSDASAITWRGHAYHARGAGVRPLTADGMLIVGDAAGLAYPESGEGIRPAVESGLLAARTLIVANGRCTRDALQPYDLTIRSAHRPATPAPKMLTLVVKALGRSLLRSSAFARHVVLDRWFLRALQ